MCHINDLPETVKSTVRLFADDCLLYREIRSFEDHLSLTSGGSTQAGKMGRGMGNEV